MISNKLCPVSASADIHSSTKSRDKYLIEDIYSIVYVKRMTIIIDFEQSGRLGKKFTWRGTVAFMWGFLVVQRREMWPSIAFIATKKKEV